MFEIPVVNQTQVEVTETLNEDARERNNIESVTNERGMESLHVFKDIETKNGFIYLIINKLL